LNNKLIEKEPEFNEIWMKLENKLGKLLRITADICLKKELINKTQYERYFVSGKLIEF
jgi:hypothetical protein